MRRCRSRNVDSSELPRRGTCRTWAGHHHAALSQELSEKFEDIEHKEFGKDGFEDAVKQIAQVERALGFEDLAKFTAPAPPAS